MTKRCNANRSKGRGKCQRPAGWGTDHAGSGRCKLHGGSSPGGRKAAAKEAALEFARGALGDAVPGSPLDAMQESVDLARGLILWYRHELSSAALLLAGTEEEKAKGLGRIAELRPSYEDAIKLENVVSKAAIDAGVAERRQRLAELQAEFVAGMVLRAVGAVFGELLTADRQAALAVELGREFEAVEGTVVGEDRPAGLPAAA